MTWKDYCRVAAVYSLAYEHDIDTEVSMANATKCIEKARILQPDSVRIFIANMDARFSSSMNVVMHTLDGLNTDKTMIGDHEESEFLENEEDIHNDSIDVKM